MSERVNIAAGQTGVGGGGAEHVSPDPGMSLRDGFAGHALTGIIANQQISHINSRQRWAELAYAVADLMLAERAQPNSTK